MRAAIEPEQIRGGNSITFRFDHAVELNFHRTLHQNMKGKIVVEQSTVS